MRRWSVIYDFAPGPSEFLYTWGKFPFVFYQCRRIKEYLVHRRQSKICVCLGSFLLREFEALFDCISLLYTDKKDNTIFLICKDIFQKVAVKKSSMSKGLLIWLNICAFPHILGSHSSFMTLQLLPSEFPYMHMRKTLFSFLSGYLHMSFSLGVGRYLCRLHFWISLVCVPVGWSLGPS